MNRPRSTAARHSWSSAAAPDGPESLKWHGWGTATATGKGIGYLFGQTKTGLVDPERRDVVVTLSGQVPCGGVQIYSTLTVALKDSSYGAPSWMRRVDSLPQRRRWPAAGCPEGTVNCEDNGTIGFTAHLPLTHRPRQLRGGVKVSTSPTSAYKPGGTATLAPTFANWGADTATVTGL